MSEPEIPAPLAQVALALFAEALADPVQRRTFANDPLGLMKSALESKSRSFDELDPDVQAAFVELFGDMSYEELRLLARLQTTMVGLSPEHLLAEEVEVGSHATLAKL